MVFAATSLVLVLIAASPTLSMVISWPSEETFTEFWILGPGHMAEGYPFNVKENVSSTVFLGISNHLGGLEYYVAYVKFRNQTELLPNATTAAPSPFAPLCEYRVFLSEGETWEKNFTFAFSGIRETENNVCRVSYLHVESFSFLVNKTAAWDSVNKGYYFQVFFELWRFNVASSGFHYHNRFVGIWLNMTASF
jgi:hypothetical protein